MLRPPRDSVIAVSSGDIITDFIGWSQDESSPEIFRRWTAISLVGAALERRVWIKSGPKYTWPNLYTLLVGPPGVGKGIIEKAKTLFSKVRAEGHELTTRAEGAAFNIGDDTTTPQGMIDLLASTTKTLYQSDGNYEYKALALLVEEFGTFMPMYDMFTVSLLNNLYACKEYYSTRTRSGKPPLIELNNTAFNFLGGVQPAFISSVFPEETWTTGLGRRCMMIYDDTPMTYSNPFLETMGITALEKPLLTSFASLSRWYGQIDWSGEAMDEMIAWWHGRQAEPVPTHSKLVAYNRNRQMNVFKLCAISVASRMSSDKLVLLDDFLRAKQWMLEAEALMPDIFRAMVGKNDWQVLEELHRFILGRWTSTGQKSVSGPLVRSFLAAMVPGNKAIEILVQAETAGHIRRDTSKPGEWFLPAPKITRTPE